MLKVLLRMDSKDSGHYIYKHLIPLMISLGSIKLTKWIEYTQDPSLPPKTLKTVCDNELLLTAHARDYAIPNIFKQHSFYFYFREVRYVLDDECL